MHHHRSTLLYHTSSYFRGASEAKHHIGITLSIFHLSRFAFAGTTCSAEHWFMKACISYNKLSALTWCKMSEHKDIRLWKLVYLIINYYALTRCKMKEHKDNYFYISSNYQVSDYSLLKGWIVLKDLSSNTVKSLYFVGAQFSWIPYHQQRIYIPNE